VGPDARDGAGGDGEHVSPGPGNGPPDAAPPGRGAPLGRVVELWRYPVKSMAGATLASTTVDALGIPGDRAYALLDVAAGSVASAKHPRKWAALPACTVDAAVEPLPAETAPRAVIRLPTGERVPTDDPEADRKLSAFFGREVSLVRGGGTDLLRESDRPPLDHPTDGDFVRVEPMGAGAPPGRYFDYAPLHLITTASLRALERLEPGASFDRRRFRANLVVDVEGERFVENAWMGRTLRVGSALLEVFDPAGRCVVTTLPQDGLAREPAVLRAIARANAVPSLTKAPGETVEAVVGVYARVVHPGVIATGDALFVEEGARRSVLQAP